ncbi:MAG: hypothetical protein JSV62_13600 [Promethearchaeota archaeon]|nr:MAG: hypothetical protein JSV62_13600 [Candidatus Lokiarchaeota archaeon]
MNLQKEYEKLYQYWLNEFQQKDLTEFNNEIFNHFKKSVDYINDYQENNMNEIKIRLLQSYKDNFNYLFTDLLKMRELKITHSALALKEINLDNIIEAEKLLYENLVSSVKGYNKLKAVSIYEEEPPQIDKIIEPEIEIKSVVEKDLILSDEKSIKISKNEGQTEQKKFNYTLVRFIKKTPPLVGVDLINYGPFEAEDVANLPEKNAKILIYEKFAEKIEIN